MSLERIINSCRAGIRLEVDDARELFLNAPMWLLSQLALDRKRGVSGDKIFYNRNFHIEPTNICVIGCKFCSYRRDEGSDEAWSYSIEQMAHIAQRYVGSNVSEVHIVGGVHPDRDIHFYAELIATVKSILPTVAIKAFTAVELNKMISNAGMTIREGLQLLQQAGMEAIPGGGAEIFAPHIRGQICPQKGSAEEWLALHEEAHKLGISTNATILYGHIESLEDRLDHLDRLRKQQDKSGGFNAFIPLKYRSAGNELSVEREVSVVADLRMIAISRLFLDNIPHIKAYWVMYGKVTTELALLYGADDVDGTVDDTTKIYSMAGAEDQRPRITVEEIERMAQNTGFIAVERDTHYKIV
ncbi:MAG: CofH family radical SAM protein [Rikenellaceae bacterium]